MDELAAGRGEELTTGEQTLSEADDAGASGGVSVEWVMVDEQHQCLMHKQTQCMQLQQLQNVTDSPSQADDKLAHHLKDCDIKTGDNHGNVQHTGSLSTSTGANQTGPSFTGAP